MQISPKLLLMLIVTNIATLLALAYLILTGLTPPQQTTFKEIQAERINIVSPAGKTVIAISNKERIAPPVLEGKAYPVEVSEGRQYMAGMIFFNQDGDEMGGLIFNSFKLPNGKTAGIGHLSFDRFQDNQVIALQYKENSNSVQAGLTFFDRPSNGTFKQSLDLVEQARSAPSAQLADIKKKLADLAANSQLGVERLFVGSRNQVAQLLMKDTKGRVRARLMVDEKDEAKLEFLDEAGKVKARFPQDVVN